MSKSVHHLNCFCGQPIDAPVASASVHCTRCGLSITRSRLACHEGPLAVALTLVPTGHAA
jgi:hypothetical protein